MHKYKTPSHSLHFLSEHSAWPCSLKVFMHCYFRVTPTDYMQDKLSLVTECLAEQDFTAPGSLHRLTCNAQTILSGNTCILT